MRPEPDTFVCTNPECYYFEQPRQARPIPLGRDMFQRPDPACTCDPSVSMMRVTDLNDARQTGSGAFAIPDTPSVIATS